MLKQVHCGEVESVREAIGFEGDVLEKGPYIRKEEIVQLVSLADVRPASGLVQTEPQRIYGLLGTQLVLRLSLPTLGLQILSHEASTG